MLLASLSPSALADRLVVPHVPRHYIVRKGDTLWGIATHFFRDPWRWPGIWNRNRQIRDPNLIYPGDLIALRYAHGKPYLVDMGPAASQTRSAGHSGLSSSGTTVVLTPRVRSHALAMAIPTLSPNAIGPFLQRPLALSRRQFHRLGYVAAAVHRHTYLGPASRFYARHLGAHPDKVYEIYRRGPTLRASDGDFLAYETKYVGEARLVRGGRRLPEFQVVSSIREVEAGDRLVPWHPEPPIPYFYPRAPHRQVSGEVVAATHNNLNLGTYAAVAINIGKNAGMRRGYVLRLYSRPRRFYNPVADRTERGRRERIGLLMIFRTFPRVSYGVIMQARREIHVGDTVGTP